METGVKRGVSLREQAARIKKTVIPRPDLDNLDPWLKEHVKEPFFGFQDIPGGKNREEQLEDTRNQLRDLARTHRVEDQWPDIEVQDQLLEIVTPDSMELNASPQPTSRRK